MLRMTDNRWSRRKYLFFIITKIRFIHSFVIQPSSFDIDVKGNGNEWQTNE
jgi:hypothetical protein